jgi:hypothetical protein
MRVSSASLSIAWQSAITAYNSKSMNTTSFVERLTEQRDRVVAAIEALRGSRTSQASFAARGKRRKMSAAAKKRLSLAAKARWAKAKKAGRNRL